MSVETYKSTFKFTGNTKLKMQMALNDILYIYAYDILWIYAI